MNNTHLVYTLANKSRHCFGAAVTNWVRGKFKAESNDCRMINYFGGCCQMRIIAYCDQLVSGVDDKRTNLFKTNQRCKSRPIDAIVKCATHAHTHTHWYCANKRAPSNPFNRRRKISIQAQRAIFALLERTCVFSKYNYLLFYHVLAVLTTDRLHWNRRLEERKKNGRWKGQSL